MLISVEFRGLDEAVAKINKLGDVDLRSSLMTLCAGLMQRQTQKRLAQEKRAPSGAAWAKWSPNYRPKAGSGLMVDTGRLLGSVSSYATGGTAHVGSNVFYGLFHQEGTSKMPARPWLGLSSENETEIQDKVVDFLQARLEL